MKEINYIEANEIIGSCQLIIKGDEKEEVDNFINNFIKVIKKSTNENIEIFKVVEKQDEYKAIDIYKMLKDREQTIIASSWDKEFNTNNVNKLLNIVVIIDGSLLNKSTSKLRDYLVTRGRALGVKLILYFLNDNKYDNYRLISYFGFKVSIKHEENISIILENRIKNKWYLIEECYKEENY